ncbi:unnamed protein product [Staurois parvus]|uniref:Uncharacterized protein n=1 Tax=Staurois parvus TaxID=386267 RepID=A0ABN9BPC0_9NEOB|nr:unnamed protein product [Staurois parvus]
MNCSSPVPAALMQPQTMTLLPPCLTTNSGYDADHVLWLTMVKPVLSGTCPVLVTVLQLSFRVLGISL